MQDVVQAHYVNATACIVCLDLSDRNSFDGVEGWIEEAQASNDGDNNLLVFLVGLKGDLPRKGSPDDENEQELPFAVA